MMCKNINFKNFKKKRTIILLLNEFPYFVHQSAESAEANVDIKESLKKAKKEDGDVQSKKVIFFYL